jgi:hypothetical protein
VLVRSHTSHRAQQNADKSSACARASSASACRPLSELLPPAFDIVNVHPPCPLVKTLKSNCAADCARTASVTNPALSARIAIDAIPTETYRLAVACSISSISTVAGGICWKRKSAIA